MKKVLLVLLPLLAAFLVGMYQGAYLPIGQWVYANATDLEAKLYGFEQRSGDIGEMELAYYIHENAGKPTLVMLHGYSADKDVWMRFAKHLTADYQIVVPDMAGHGDSPFKFEWNYGMPAQAERLAKLLDVIGIEKVNVIGNSMGGFLAATFAIRYPERTESAVMMDAAGIMSPQPSDMFKMIEQGRNPFLITDRKSFDEFYAMTMEQPPLLPGVVLAAIANKYQVRREQLHKIWSDFHSSDYLENDLDKIKAPAMLWWGDKDRLLHVSAVPVWEAGIPNLKTHIFEGIGHMPMMEVPKQSARIYAEFLAEVHQQ